MANISNAAKAQYQRLADEYLAKPVKEAEEKLDELDDISREHVLRAMFRTLSRISKGTRAPISKGEYIAPKVRARMITKKDKTIVFLGNDFIQIFPNVKEAHYLFELEKLFKGADALATRIIGSDKLTEERRAVRHLTPFIAKKKEVRICISDVIDVM
jgi:hypothetical protein